MKKHIFTAIILFFLCSTLYGQITTEEDPISFGRNIPALSINPTTHKVLPPIDRYALEQEDKEDEANGIPPRFGFMHKVDYNLENSGEWITLPNGDKVWRLSLSCPGALSINLAYDQFWLPDGAKFFIYTPDHKRSIGAITSYNNKGERDNIQGFATEIMYGDQVILEYYLPDSVNEVGIISIAYVVHGYRYVNCLQGGYECSKSCHININCPEAYDWYLEKNAIAMIVLGSNRICTGALINTTANDFSPLFLTAQHCVAAFDAFGYNDLSTWSFYWHYESPRCTATGDPKYRSTTGATLIANNKDTDFALLKLIEDPLNKNKVTPYYLGWNATENPGTGGVGIHHPAGDIKKISFANQIENFPNSICWGKPPLCPDGISLPNTHWKVNFINGTTEGGSSGSPFINYDHKVIGQLHGGDTTCAPVTKYYGKLSVSWASNDTIQRQLKHWLDPNNTGALTHNGTFSCKGHLPIHNQTYNSSTNIKEDEYCTIDISNTFYQNGSTAKYWVQNRILILPGTTINAGSNVLLVARGTPASREGENLSPVYVETDGSIEIVTSLQTEWEKPNFRNTEIRLFPNPNPGAFQLETNFPLSDIAHLKITNLLGVSVYETQNLATNTIRLQNAANGLFFVVVILKDGSVLTQKMMVQR